MISNTKLPCEEGVVLSRPEVKDCGRLTGKWVLAASVLGSSLTFIDGTAVNVVLPVLQRELGATMAQAQWIVEAYALMLASLILVGGSLGDRLGRRRVFSVGVVLFAFASCWCGLAGNMTQLIVARGVQGVGAALLVPGSLALISANFSRERRGPAFGIWSGLTSVSAGIGPVLGGWLVDRFSWRWIFFINIPLATAVLLIAWRHVPESRDEETKGRVDWAGAALATVGLASFVFGLIESNSRRLPDSLVMASLTAAFAALTALLFVETRSQSPMIPFELFRSREFSGANLLTFFLYMALGGLLFFLPFNLIQVQGYTATAAGAALFPFVAVMFLLSRWAGSLVQRYGSKLPLVVGPSIAAAGFMLFAIPGVESGSYWTSFLPAILVMSVGMAITVAPLTTTVMNAVEERHSGVASGINNFLSRTASLLAVAVFGFVMLYIFNVLFTERLQGMALDSESRAQLIRQSGAFVGARIPNNLSGAVQAEIRHALRESFVKGFRVVVILSAALAAASAIVAWILIGSKGLNSEKSTGELNRPST
jgi:EmrB/QacA subfamily drug resistance transporter